MLGDGEKRKWKRVAVETTIISDLIFPETSLREEELQKIYPCFAICSTVQRVEVNGYRLQSSMMLRCLDRVCLLSEQVAQAKENRPTHS